MACRYSYYGRTRLIGFLNKVNGQLAPMRHELFVCYFTHFYIT